MQWDSVQNGQVFPGDRGPRVPERNRKFPLTSSHPPARCPLPPSSSRPWLSRMSLWGWEGSSWDLSLIIPFYLLLGWSWHLLAPQPPDCSLVHDGSLNPLSKGFGNPSHVSKAWAFPDPPMQSSSQLFLHNSLWVMAPSQGVYTQLKDQAIWHYVPGAIWTLLWILLKSPTGALMVRTKLFPWNNGLPNMSDTKHRLPTLGFPILSLDGDLIYAAS